MLEINPLMNELPNISRLIGKSHLIKLYYRLKPIYERQENWQKKLKEQLQEEHPLTQSFFYAMFSIFTDEIGQKDLCIKTEKYINILNNCSGYLNLEKKLKNAQEFRKGTFFELESVAYLSIMLERVQIGNRLELKNDCGGYWRGKTLNFEVKALRDPSVNYHKTTPMENGFGIKSEAFVNQPRDKHIWDFVNKALQQLPSTGFNFIVFVNSSRPSEPFTNFAASLFNNRDSIVGSNLCGLIVYESAFNCSKPFISCSKLFRSPDYEAEEFAWINDFHIEFKNLML